jgi:glycine cleavage system H protein
MDRLFKVSADHIWVGVEDPHVFLGITNYGQSELGEVISVELPAVGEEIEKGEPFAEVESVNTVSELTAPVSGTVLAVNTELETDPSLMNDDPYHEGWLIEVKLKERSEIVPLMDMDEYYHFVFKPKS